MPNSPYKDRKFYRVGVARRESKRPRILAATWDVGGKLPGENVGGVSGNAAQNMLQSAY